MTSAPLAFEWTGDAFKPLSRFANACDERFVVGLAYSLEEVSQPSTASRGHFFACLSEAWKNLPEDVAERFPTVEHLRKFALVKSGYADERSIVCASKAEALRLAAFIKPMDDFAVVLVSEVVVKVFTAKSQSARAMGKVEFQESKQKVLDYVSSLIGVHVDKLKQNADKAA